MPGRHFLQIPGPTNIPDRLLRAMDRPVINHRGAAFADVSKKIFPKLKKLFKTEKGSPLVFPTSGTGAWECSLVNTLSPGDRVLAFDIGNFSGEFSRAAANLGYDVIPVQLPPGSGIPAERVYQELSGDGDKRIKAVLAIHNETATGVTANIPAIREAIDRAGHPALFVVDTVSGVGSIDFRFDEWGVDVAVTGSQKGLMLPPGLGLLCVSEKAREAHRHSTSPRHFFDWGAMFEANAAGFYPYTPATPLIFGLTEALDMLLEEGLENVFARHTRLAAGVRKAVAAWGLELLAEKPEEASDVLTVVVVPDHVDSNALVSHAENDLDLALGGGLGALNGRVFRIGHLGWLNDLEVLATLAGVEMALHRHGMKLDLGSGVAACQQWFMDSRNGT